MDAHIATKLVRSVLAMFSDMLRGNPQTTLLRPSRQEASEKALLSKEEKYGKVGSKDRIEHAFFEVRRFLANCGARGSRQPPPPKRISCEKRPRWNGAIINLTPVVGGALVVPT